MSRARHAPSEEFCYPVRPIGVVRSPFKVHEGTPRQPGVAPIADGEIVLRPGLQNALKDLKGFSHVWVLFWCNYSRGWNEQVVPPRDEKKRGLFATRSPHRPNPIGLSVVRLLDVRGRTLRIRGLDMLDGTPVLDLKPYVPYVDAIPDASEGWLAELPREPRPDHRPWKALRAAKQAAKHAARKSAGQATLLLTWLALLACAPESAPTATSSSAPPASVAGGGGANGSVLDAPIERPTTGDAAAAAQLVQQARALQQAQRLDDARRALDEALARDPANVPALIDAGWLRLARIEEDAGEALLLFRRARTLEPENLDAIAGEGIARAALGDPARAEPLLRRALAELATSPGSPGSPGSPRAGAARALANGALADLCAADDRNDEALLLYSQAETRLASSPDLSPSQRAGLLVRSGALLAQLARPIEAEAKLTAALAIDREDLRAHYLLSQLLAKRGATDEARREARLHELYRQLRDHVSTRHRRDLDRRIAIWREIVALDPGYARAPRELVRELLEGARWEAALAEIAALTKRDGATAEMHYLTARAKAGAGDLAGAKTAADAMRGADPNVPAGVLRAVLEDWRRGNPEIDAATYERTAREWLGGE